MSAFSEKYSAEQKQAVRSAILDGVPGQPGSGPLGRGEPQLGQPMTAREAVAAAAEGRLPDVAAFAMNLSTARNEAQLERRERRGQKSSRLDRKPVLEAGTEVVRRALRIADHAMRRIEQKPRQSPPTLDEAQKVVKLAAEVDRLTKQHATKVTGNARGQGPQAGDDQGAGEPAAPRDIIDELAAEEAQTGGPSSTTLEETQAPMADSEESATSCATSAQHDTPADSRDAGARFPSHTKTSAVAPDAARLAAAQAVLSGAERGV